MSVLNYGYAVWAPIVWLIALVVIGVIVLVWRNRGQKGYKKGTAQTDVFLSGIKVPPEEQRHVKAENIYWGFFEALKGLYTRMMKPHTGIVNDYILWFVAVMAITILILVLAS
ncbi:MAG: hydrogenase [Dehalococcoidia bacterium]